MPSADPVLEELDRLIMESGTMGGFTHAGVTQFTTGARAIVEHIAGRHSVYMQSIDSVLGPGGVQFNPDYLTMYAGIRGALVALHNSIGAGLLQNMREEVHAETFADFLEASEHLLHEGVKPHETAAAVLAGGVLEQHIRLLCDKHGIPTTRLKNGKPEPKNVDLMNNELVKAEAYGKLDKGNVTQWYRIRTDAAHARYKEYDKCHVRSMIAGLRKFISDFPA